MRTHLLLTAFVLLGIRSAYGQNVTIALLSGPNICAGYSLQNRSYFTIENRPASVIRDQTAIVYTWYARHEKGTWQWHTPVASRWIPLPWQGTYEVWMVMHYVSLSNRRTYASFTSNKVQIQAYLCEEPNSGDKPADVQH